MFALDVAFIFGLFISLTKGADLLLRPHQQKRVQKFFEEITLILSYTKAIEPALRHLRGATKNKLILYISTLLGFIAFFANISVLYEYFYDYIIINRFVTFFLFTAICFFTGWVSACISLDINEYWIRWYLSAKNWKQLLWKSLFAVQYLILLFLFSFSPILWRGISYGYYVQLSAFLSISYCIVIFFTVVTILELSIKIVRAITWRIVEYNKGAYAALTLIFTIIIGIVDLYLSKK